MPHHQMPARDVALGLLVVLIWGFNFVAIAWGLEGMPPLLIAAIRFCAVIFPAVLVVPKPDARWRDLAMVGLFMSAGQFGFLYLALSIGLPAGIASVVHQSQVFLTVIVAFLVLREGPTRTQVAGIGVGVVGLVIVGLGRGGHAAIVPMLVCLLASLSWAIGNVSARQIKVPSGLALTVWSGIFVPVPLFLASYVVEGPHRMVAAMQHFGWPQVFGTAYTAFVSSLIGYTLWNGLLSRHPTSSVAPLTLLVPPIGMASTWLCLGEHVNVVEIVGAVVLMAGVAVTVTSRRRRRRTPPAELAAVSS